MTRQEIYDSLVELACKTIPSIDKAALQKMLSIQVPSNGMLMNNTWIAAQRPSRKLVTNLHLLAGTRTQTSAVGKKGSSGLTQDVKWCEAWLLGGCRS